MASAKHRRTSEEIEDSPTEVKGRARSANQPQADNKKKRSVFYEILSYIATIALVFFLTAALKLYVIDIYSVPTGSMIPTIEIDDRILSEKVSPHFSPVRPKEVVTFNDPVTEGRILVKRVIAVGGQTIDLIGGYVYVDGIVVDEPYTHGKPTYPLVPLRGVDIDYPFTVPEGTIWVMGDNRTDSLDSRYFGAVSEELITGRSLVVVWPIDHFGGFD